MTAAARSEQFECPAPLPRVLPALESGITVSGADLSAPAAFTVGDVADDPGRVNLKQVGVVAEPERLDADGVEHVRQSRLSRWQKLGGA